MKGMDAKGYGLVFVLSMENINSLCEIGLTS